MRIVVRLGLAAALILCLLIGASAFLGFGPVKVEAWAVIAAVLATITSIVSTFAAQRVLEMQEDATMPVLTPSFDVDSRYSLIQLKVTNHGATPALNVKVDFSKELRGL